MTILFGGGLEIQILRSLGEELVVMSRHDFDVLRARAGDEDAEDLVTSRMLRETRDQTAVPAEIVDAILDGAPPVKVLLSYRRMTQKALADRSGLSQPFISKLVRGKVGMRGESRDALARALGVSRDLLDA